MDIHLYLDPLKIPTYGEDDESSQRLIANSVIAYTDQKYFPELKNVDIAIVGVREDRMAVNNAGCANGPDSIRAHLYPLHNHWPHLQIADLGNIPMGNSIEDSYFALREVVAALVKENIFVIILGGSQDLTFANYRAYENIGRVVNIVSMDPRFDLGHDENDLNSQSYLSKIILHQPNFLFNYTNLGYQNYYVDRDAVKLMDDLFFDVYRLGKVRSAIEESEPIVRNADILSIDLSSIRMSDAPGNKNGGPNGFTAEEACQICRFAGFSDKLSSIGIYELNPEYDRQSQTAQLSAQMIWYLMDGVANRKNDLPSKESEEYIRYRVKVEQLDEEVNFLKSKKTSRWWMEVPLKNTMPSQYERHHLVPCTYKDYQSALNQDIPERWWQVYQKMM